jgi:hypothetical protein
VAALIRCGQCGRSRVEGADHDCSAEELCEHGYKDLCPNCTLGAAAHALEMEFVLKNWHRVEMNEFAGDSRWRCAYGRHYVNEIEGWSSKREESPCVICTSCRFTMDHAIEAAERGWLR